MSGQAGRYQRTAGGMVGALVVLVAVVLGFVVLRDLNRSDPASPVNEVDYTRAAEHARQNADFPVVAPPSLPAGWRATSVRFVDGTNGNWHLGLLTDEDQYVGVEQSSSSPRSMVDTHVDSAADRAGTVTVDGDRWARWTDESGDTALVREGEGITTLVVGHEVPADELQAFVASLR
jgi:hypothetical protein